jgi:hypothetical protein
MYDQAETFLILKYGSIHEAYRAWLSRLPAEQTAISDAEYSILMEFEYNMRHDMPSPLEPL